MHDLNSLDDLSKDLDNLPLREFGGVFELHVLEERALAHQLH